MFDINQKSYTKFRSIIKERTNPLVAWIGSGFSVTANIPNWSELRKQLTEALDKKIENIYEPEDKNKAITKRDYIESIADYWHAFQELSEALGKTTYETTIKEAFKNASSCIIPRTYLNSMKLPISGVLTLNLDRLVSRAYSQINPGKSPNEFQGRDCGDYVHLLQSQRPFIANLHGIVDQTSSWVLQKRHLNALFNNDGYKTFINTVLCSKTVVFLGISVDDIAVGSHLENLKRLNIDFGSHFWITSRKDSSADKWAEDVNVSIIRYSDAKGHHELAEMFNDIQGFMPTDTPASPVLPSLEQVGKFNDISLEELEQRDDEEIRIYLNYMAKNILNKRDSKKYDEFSNFLNKFDKFIHRAWYFSENPPDNIILGYKIKREIAEGAFGRVFEAEDKKGLPVALKLLKQDVRRKPEMMQGFRRGVQSMRILEEHGIHGMIPYKDSSEIPAFAVMPLVEGPNLKDAVLSKFCEDWSSVLFIAVELCSIIRSAHMVPERVLHRDLRPANIMLQGYYSNPQNYSVVVLDFDLSWYKGSDEVSVINSSSLNGFLAPEQVNRQNDVSTRNSAVDSFGIGMTLYFLRTKLEPIYMEHKHNDWKNNLFKRIFKYSCDNWTSAPYRYARVIYSATKNRQSDRLDLSQILAELELLRQAVSSPLDTISTELIAEEIISRSCIIDEKPFQYEWNVDESSATVKLMSGVLVSCSAAEETHSVDMHFRWRKTGSEEYKNIQKYLKNKCNTSISDLKKGGWIEKKEISYSSDQAEFIMTVKKENALKNISKLSSSLSEAIVKFKFD